MIDAKNRIFQKLAPLDFVSGAGVQAGTVAIYLSRPLTKHEEQQVARAIGSLRSPPPVKFVVTGTFKAQN